MAEDHHESHPYLKHDKDADTSERSQTEKGPPLTFSLWVMTGVISQLAGLGLGYEGTSTLNTMHALEIMEPLPSRRGNGSR